MATQFQTKTFDIIILIALFLVSLAIRLLILAPTGFDGLYGQDPFAYYDFAQQLQYFAQTFNPPGPFFWSVGYPLTLAITFSIFGTSATVAQGLSIIMGALLSPMIYTLSRQFQVNRIGAIIMSLIITVSGQVMQSSLVVMADIPALFWALLSALALWRYIDTAKRRWLILCSLTITLAVLTRWVYLILLAPWLLAVIIGWKGHIRVFDTSLALLSAFTIAIPQIAYNFVNPTQPFSHSWVVGWSPLNALQDTFTNIDGQFQYESVNAIFYAQPYYESSYIAAIFTPFLFIGGVYLLWKKRYTHGIFLGIWAFAAYLFLAGIPYQNIRFPLIVFPAVLILIGIGMSALLELAHKHITSIPIRRGIIFLLVGICSLGLWLTFDSGRNLVNTFIANQQRDKDIVQWVNQQLDSGDKLYTFGIRLTIEHYTDLNVLDIFYESPNLLNQRWRRGQDDYLLLNIWNIENQWVGRTPQENYHWFRDERGLQEMGRLGNYTLFRILG